MTTVNTVTGPISADKLGRPNIMTPVMEKNMRHANIRRIGDYVIPKMKRRGFSDDLIDTFLEKNPGRFFGA